MRAEWKRYARPDLVARWLDEDLARRFPKGEFEIRVREAGELYERVWEGSLANALQEMVRTCGRPMGLALHYEPLHPYGLICTAVCDCVCMSGPCLSWEWRPRVTVVLLNNGAGAVLIGRRGELLRFSDSRVA